MLEIVISNQFKKDLKLAKKRRFKLDKPQKVINILATKQVLGSTYKDHSLSGNYKGFRECHVEPDWLLIYRIDNDILSLFLFRTDTHSDLFRRFFRTAFYYNL